MALLFSCFSLHKHATYNAYGYRLHIIIGNILNAFGLSIQSYKIFQKKERFIKATNCVKLICIILKVETGWHFYTSVVA